MLETSSSDSSDEVAVRADELGRKGVPGCVEGLLRGSRTGESPTASKATRSGADDLRDEGVLPPGREGPASSSPSKAVSLRDTERDLNGEAAFAANRTTLTFSQSGSGDISGEKSEPGMDTDLRLRDTLGGGWTVGGDGEGERSVADNSSVQA